MVASLVVALLAATTSPRFEATLLDDSAVAGRIVGWSDKSIDFDGESGVQNVPASKLLSVTRLAPDRSSVMPQRPTNAEVISPTSPEAVRLVDGTLLRGFGCTFSGKRVALRRPDGQTFELESGSVASIELQTLTPAARELWMALDEQSLTGDALVINKRDGASADYIVGLVREISDDRVIFEWDGESVEVNRAKAAGVVLFRKAVRRSEPTAGRFLLDDGSQIAAQRATLEAGQLVLETLSAKSLRVALGSLLEVDLSGGKLAYLSVLEPVSVRWTPSIALPSAAAHLGRAASMRVDRSFDGGPLTLFASAASPTERPAKVSYRRGLAMRSRCEVVYNVPDGMSRLLATAGIDPLSAREGNVHMTIYGEKAALWEGDVDGSAAPTAMNVALQGSRRIRIVVDYGANLDTGDRVHLVDARFTR
ncbi:MAG: NPCBM/NEW2 domain-containing protein [Planctomycetales bacterium]|nr:NPCBM/NEW2 domain-containing protein [Planctomycetales bacterium]